MEDLKLSHIDTPTGRVNLVIQDKDVHTNMARFIEKVEEGSNKWNKIIAIDFDAT